jgi:Alginate lyase
VKKAAVFIFLVYSCYAALSVAGQTLVLDQTLLEKNRLSIKDKKEPEKVKALAKLVTQAERILKKGKLYSVMNKKQLPPSGDKHDYFSQSPYWWPDPAKPDGLPYIRRDGQRNPELDNITDAGEMDDMVGDVEELALAYFFTGEEKFAKFGATLVRTWFLDPKTRQNPHLNFAQRIPGINKNRGIGLIETRDLYRVIDATMLLEKSNSWPTTDQQALKAWFSEFLKWMTTSPVGLDEADEKNNHGTYYNVQVLSYALYTGDRAMARKHVETAKERIRSQIETDGRQPHELARTLSWNYVNMNLYGFLLLARLAEHEKADLWNYSADGRGIKKAVDWVAPYASGDKKWTYEQINAAKFNLTIPILRRAAKKFERPEYKTIANRLEAAHDTSEVERLTN